MLAPSQFIMASRYPLPYVYTAEEKTSQSSSGSIVSSILTKTGLKKSENKTQTKQNYGSEQSRLSTESVDTIQRIKEENESKQRWWVQM